MKKVILSIVVVAAFLFQFCSSGKKIQAPVVVKLTYEANIKPIIATKCTPCHIPPQGNKEPYVTYAAVVKDVDDMIRRINLTPGVRGFMPQRNPKLSDSTIHIFEQWKADGLLEK